MNSPPASCCCCCCGCCCAIWWSGLLAQLTAARPRLGKLTRFGYSLHCGGRLNCGGDTLSAGCCAEGYAMMPSNISFMSTFLLPHKPRCGPEGSSDFDQVLNDPTRQQLPSRPSCCCYCCTLQLVVGCTFSLVAESQLTYCCIGPHSPFPTSPSPELHPQTTESCPHPLRFVFQINM